ncbi:RAD50 DNA repair-like protein [Leptomonas pyrrhocoris]|uniref:DNA repair protein RAD50 n=1 Tax=Leptomonas pyrrhocoris TaxID=157538 RepID=A0A0N0DZN4_LEPPY|nr:RAD50 DNA repair-like protein [Leptomonas pyrrhocoris]XP_015663945.1 RAD50 DNA repair-like protein [Leptomonas pyrrhocoris]KPA85505.1 RAD50 DNA repair-like protein [Leptomonas pyrrhocoris]KPA85506.1 RAD50 DNA repair-like protein [Leptomonas pyrrhocoris]|eukprot:XP_015663944.1 RAD50 DNA repair-like protein [Leptomonas pyrrhocoris]
MTSIEKIQICGVRSFDPNPANQQFIQFQKPLTVILGKNGAGKTTIIEALLNACTGAMPPGSGTEKGSFVYDPKVVGETEVKAQIRLIFTGKGGKLMQVIRSFQATRSSNRVTFTTLDNTVAFQDAATGEVISSTYRASDVDRVVPEMLGVSSAVLAHVIFCHQEDCNWPLGPPKDVKRIFDDIFAATRYVLALDRLRDNSKEFRRQLKEHEASLMALREHREQAKQLQQQIDQKDSVIRAIQGRSTGIEPELQELRQALTQLRSVEDQIESMQREVAVTQARLEERREAVRRADLPLSTQTLETMQEMRSNFGAQIQHVEEELAQNTKRHDAVAQTRRTQEEELYRTRSNIQLLERDDQQHKLSVARLRELLSELSSEYVLGENDVDERSLQRLLRKAESDAAAARQQLRSATAGLQQSIRAEESEVQSGLRLLDGNLTETQMRQQSLDAVRQRVKDNARAIAGLGGDSRRVQLRQLQAEIEELQQRVAAAEELRRKDTTEQRSQAILKELEEQNIAVATLREEMMRQKQRERSEQEAEHLRRQVEESNVSVAAALQNDVLPLLRAVGVQAPVVATDAFSPSVLLSLRSQATQVHQAKANELQALQSRVFELQKARATQEQKSAYLSEELVQCQREVSDGLAQCVNSVTDLDTYEEYLRQAREAAESSTQKWHAMEALVTCYHDFMSVAMSENKCAVCERPFADHDVRQKFLEINADKQRATPQALAAVRGAADTAQEAYQRLEKLQGVVVSVRQHRSRIPVLEEELKSLVVQMEQNTAAQGEARAARDAAQTAVQQLEGVCHHLAGLCMMEEKATALKATLTRREKEVEAASPQEEVIGAVGEDGDDQVSSRRTFDELSEAYAAATDRLHQLNKLFTEAQRMERGQDEHAAQRQLQERKAAMYQAEVSVAKLEDLEKTSAELQQEAAQHRGRLEELTAQVATLRTSVDARQAKVQELRAECQRAEEAERHAVEQAEARLRQLQLAVPPVLSYVQSGGAQRLEELRVHLREAEKACTATVQELDGLMTHMEDARRTLSDQHRRSADMDRHIEALQQQQSIALDETHLAETAQILVSLKTDRLQGVEQLVGEEARQASLSTLRELITAKMTSLEKIRAQQDGNMEAMLLDVAQLKQQLRSDKYQSIEKRYRSTFLKVQTTEISIQDIEKYYSALEKAVQSYHQEKIAQINQIIAELWRQTYRGSDIDTVEIRSETEGTTTTAARRSFNYRVVMKRGNNEMDMRGRCSAGQKVLASIVIRLALSEAFCCDCGILALDEPTTNLDDDNARSLAAALRTLIQARRAVKHFQLIVITHDEQFVRALGGQSLDKFFYIHKDREGAFSVIEERTFDQLFA